ncbi:MvdC/MvdD family ATP grasp protein [Paenibacillus piscarius]|uniref:MvdC/MvdD family ATP grasp protein n=1 Tax=Paenibacillus piscarius TaxID=1089681 RepID=UPI001EE831D2|nr:hypothetical protein [Paenibacillus piscarius]
MILILTDRFDKHADRVIEILRDQKRRYVRFNLDVESLKKTYLHHYNSNWQIRTEDDSFNSTEVSTVWARRPFVELTLEEQSNNSNDFKLWKAEWNKTLLGLYLDLNDIPWLNPVRKAYKAENKYLQRKLALSTGFKVPDLIVSNNKQEILNFSNKHEKVVLKLMSQEFYTMDDGTFKGIYVNQVSNQELLEFNDTAENPIVLQEYIDKSYEVRYTIVGKEHLACRIESQKSEKTAIDWRRYDIPNTPHFPFDPPIEIKDKINDFMSTLELEYGAMDFIVTPENEWYFLEINCMGQWLWIEDLTGLSISTSIANWLISNSSCKGGEEK